MSVIYYFSQSFQIVNIFCFRMADKNHKITDILVSYIYMTKLKVHNIHKFGWGNHHASYLTRKEARAYVAYMIRLKVHSMPKLLKKTMNHELS
jgi:hypothetical protein